MIDWEIQNDKKLPWRYTYDPYKVLIFEKFFRNLPLALAVEAYKEFFKHYSKIGKLAKAPNNELLSFFNKIGYSQDTISELRKITKFIINNFDGKIPDKKEELLLIPGIDRNIASAVRIFGFKKRDTFLSKDSFRLLSKVFNADQDTIPVLAEILAPEEYVDVYHYGLIDLGSSICLITYPKHWNCPLRQYCITAMWVNAYL